MQQLTSLLMCTLYAPTWTARKLDKKATKEVKDANGVAESLDVGNFNKLLLPDCKSLKDIQSLIGGVRAGFYLRSAPWGETRGVRVVKAEDYMDLMVWFGDQKAKLAPLLEAFRIEYPTKIAALEYEMHGLFDVEAYPPWDVVEGKFDLRLSAVPLPNANDIRVLTEIPQHVRDEIEAQLIADQQNVFTSSITHAYTELLKPIAHMAKQLKAYDEVGEDGKKKKLYGSLVENVREMAAAARRLNIARDPQLEQLACDAESLVAGYTSKELKESDGFRIDKAKAAQELADRVAKFLP